MKSLLELLSIFKGNTGTVSKSTLPEKPNGNGNGVLVMPLGVDVSAYDFTDYMKILETYAVSWSLEKVARDTLQNFFDGNNGTLDGVVFDLNKDSERGDSVLRIESDAEYDCRMLFHLGGTTKSDNSHAAGGFGEGAKILSLVLLRDYGFSQVRFGSGDWEVDFFLAKLPESQYAGNKRGLFLGFKQVECRKGNFIEFKTEERRSAASFLDAKSLFRSSENSNFEDITLDVPGIGGIKFIGNSSGNFYCAGQRYYVKCEGWNNLKNVHIFAYSRDLIVRDRDRGVVSLYEVMDNVVERILKAAEIPALTSLVDEMKMIWPRSSSFGAGRDVLEKLVRELYRRETKLNFENTYLAHSASIDSFFENLIEKEGHVICCSFFEQIGMKTTAQRLSEFPDDFFKYIPNHYEKTRTELLYEAVKLLGGRGTLPIVVYVKDQTIFDGKYTGFFVLLEKNILHLPFHQAFAVYLHELDHKHGHDGSPQFSYALTNTLGQVINELLEKPTNYNRISQEWQKSLNEEHKK